MNFITSVNCATEISVSAIQTCLNPFVISMLIRKFFFRLREQWMYTSRYTQSPPVDHAPVSYYCCVIFVISLLFPRFKTQRKWRYRQLPAFIIILHKTDKTIFKLLKHEINYASQNTKIHAKSQIL